MAAPYCPVNPASAMAVLYSIWRAMGARTSSKSTSPAKAIMSSTVRLLRLSGGWAASSEKGLLSSTSPFFSMRTTFVWLPTIWTKAVSPPAKTRT